MTRKSAGGFPLNRGAPQNDPKLFFQKKRPHADKWVGARRRFPTIKEKKFNSPRSDAAAELLLLMDANINYISFSPIRRHAPPSALSITAETSFSNLLRSDVREYPMIIFDYLCRSRVRARALKIAVHTGLTDGHLRRPWPAGNHVLGLHSDECFCRWSLPGPLPVLSSDIFCRYSLPSRRRFG